MRKFGVRWEVVDMWFVATVKAAMDNHQWNYVVRLLTWGHENGMIEETRQEPAWRTKG
jgi:hypothetical protein